MCMLGVRWVVWGEGVIGEWVMWVFDNIRGLNIPNHDFVRMSTYNVDIYYVCRHMRKYTKTLTQHLQLHVCGVYVGLPVGCVRPGGHWGVSYVSIRWYMRSQHPKTVFFGVRGWRLLYRYWGNTLKRSTNIFNMFGYWWIVWGQGVTVWGVNYVMISDGLTPQIRSLRGDCCFTVISN